MRILVTGGEGMLAKAVARVCGVHGDEVHAPPRRELDITDREAVAKALGGFSPDAIINCAAYTDVDGAETEKEHSRAVNAEAVGLLAEAAASADISFVTVSTDYVFKGDKDGFYTEEDPPDPQSVYARTKLLGEELASRANPRSIIVRSGWIFGKDGTNFLSVMHKMLSRGDRIKAISDAFGTPTFAEDLAATLRELAATGSSGVFHIVNAGEGTSYHGFAREVCSFLGMDPGSVGEVSDADLARPAPRPRNSRLASVRLASAGIGPLPDWRDGLRRFLLADEQ